MHTDDRSPTLPTSRPRLEAELRILAATKWVAGGLVEPSPDALDFIEAVKAGLVRLGDPWEVTARGRAALRRQGWM
jgi:hypothetical protein